MEVPKMANGLRKNTPRQPRMERLVFEDTNLVQEAFHNKEETGNDDGSSKSGQYSKQSIKMMSMMGWREGQGLGAKKDVIKEPVPNPRQ